jgi:hypothetical protein
VAEDLLGLGKATEAITTQLTEFIKTLLGPAAQELGQLISDPIKNYRFKQAVKRLQEAQKRLAASGIKPKSVPLKTLYPILEGCSLEEDNSDLTSKWVGLLTSAAAGHTIHASYPKILSELSPAEAKMLDFIFEQSFEPDDPEVLFEPKEVNASIGLPPEQLKIAVVNLGRLGLCSLPVEFRARDAAFNNPVLISETAIKLTSLGRDFVISCRGPQKPTF